MPPARRAVDLFHKRFTAGQDASIFVDTDIAWGLAMDKDVTLKYLARIQRLMGTCLYTGPVSWRSRTSGKGTWVTLNYAARCANGPMDERFTVRIDGDKGILGSYRAMSDQLLTE
jgi:hypothetical protein